MKLQVRATPLREHLQRSINAIGLERAAFAASIPAQAPAADHLRRPHAVTPVSITAVQPDEIQACPEHGGSRSVKTKQGQTTWAEPTMQS